MLSLYRRWRIRQILRQPLSPERARWLSEHVAAYSSLEPPMRRRLEQIALVMIQRCHWEGCEGLAVTDQMRTLVAGHAAVMLLGAHDYYFDSVTAILVYPGVIRRSHEGRQSPTVGEAWANGGVVLSWPEVEGIGRGSRGHNVVIHEFAHHLDGSDGEMGGSIPFSSSNDQTLWQRVATQEYERLVDDVHHRRRTVLDPYGATNEAEFFAVSSESFFEQPHLMCQHHTELFELLVRFYQMDPRAWNDR
jgi:Mlc titration factor MtfA (ptsG expression regulator)